MDPPDVWRMTGGKKEKPMMHRHNLWLLPALTFTILPGCTAEKTTMMKGGDMSPQAEVSTTPLKVALSVPGYASTEHLQAVYFGLNSSKLNAEAQAIIQKNAEWLKQNPPFLVKVVGLSDSRGSDKHNKTLAERRALRVREAYSALGIPGDRIFVLGVGNDPSVHTELTEAALSQSRRVETLIENKAIASK
jgi:outer membrane protein OmpA-like peptidoglycan-associated protein